MLRIKVFAGIVVLVVIGVFCSSWGFLVHRTINQLAVYQLPKKMRPFFYANMDYLVKESVNPDNRRNTDPAEAPKHFIDLEVYGDSAAWKMPLHWDDAVKRYTKDTLLKYGYVPYEVIVVKNQLTGAFRNGNIDSILLYAADLGHYIGDAHVPLHTSSNYDGQLTNQKGVHSLWETMVPEIELNQYNLYSGHDAGYLSDPEQSIWDAVRSGFVLVKGVFDAEKEASIGFTDSSKYRMQVRKGKEYRSYTANFEKVYNIKLGKTVNEQLLRSADLTADFWYTCWVDAGRPDLGNLMKKSFERKDKKELKRECKVYRENKLIEKKLLISRKQNANVEM